MNKNENQTFIEEIEKNSKIFAEKLNKLNSSHESDNSQKKRDFKKYKFTQKKNIYKKEYYQTENNYEDNNIFKTKKPNNNYLKNN